VADAVIEAHQPPSRGAARKRWSHGGRSRGTGTKRPFKFPIRAVMAGGGRYHFIRPRP